MSGDIVNIIWSRDEIELYIEPIKLCLPIFVPNMHNKINSSIYA